VSVFCPVGSGKARKVSRGYYTTGGVGTKETDASSLVSRTGEQICPPGTYCKEGVKIECPAGRYGRRKGLHNPACDGLCSRGYYCPKASTSSQQVPCPAGRFGSSKGLRDNGCSGVCTKGYVCKPATVNQYAHKV
jgi:hypothetical protein